MAKFLVRWNLEGQIEGLSKKTHSAGEFIEVQLDKVKDLVDKQHGGNEKNGSGVLVPVTDHIDVTDGSGSEKYGASDWTAAGQDKDGFPVAKGSAADVTA